MLTAAWIALALVHLAPAAVLARPDLLRSLYGVDAGGDLGVLLTHRGALFLGIVMVCAYAAFEPNARRAASLVVGISVASFLVLYCLAGMPAGSLRLIAWVDAAALPALGFVAWQAWRVGP
jgi:hypothetical protein